MREKTWLTYRHKSNRWLMCYAASTRGFYQAAAECSTDEQCDMAMKFAERDLELKAKTVIVREAETKWHIGKLVKGGFYGHVCTCKSLVHANLILEKT